MKFLFCCEVSAIGTKRVPRAAVEQTSSSLRKDWEVIESLALIFPGRILVYVVDPTFGQKQSWMLSNQNMYCELTGRSSEKRKVTVLHWSFAP